MSKTSKDPLQELRRVEKALKELGRELREDLRVSAAEMADRQRLGLTGEEAIRHYNDWMMLHGLRHLVVD